MENEIWMWLLPIILLPVFFAMGWFASLKWQKEVVAQNRPEGNAVWLKAVFPLSK